MRHDIFTFSLLVNIYNIMNMCSLQSYLSHNVLEMFLLLQKNNSPNKSCVLNQRSIMVRPVGVYGGEGSYMILYRVAGPTRDNTG